MLLHTTWHSGCCYQSEIFPNVLSEKESGTTTVSNPSDGITRTTTWPGKIALPYPSDYGYATDLSKCSQKLNNYNSSTDSYACRSNDWMYPIISKNIGWLLTPTSGRTNGAFRVDSTGCVSYYYVFLARVVAPVLYLGSDQDIVSGDGSQSNPYQLKA